MVHDEWALACVRDETRACNHRDWSAWESLCALDLVYESPHSLVGGRTAVRRRHEELIALVPDLHASQVRMLWNDPAHNLAAFELVQTGTLATYAPTPDGEVSRSAPFVVHTNLIVEFDADGRIATLISAHR